jgi:thioesterase domain-containing protein
VEIQPEGSRPPLLLVHGAGGGMFWGYSNLARHLGLDQPVFAFKSRGLEGKEEFDTIEQLAEAYLADLRIFRPHGPYHLGGYCFGGVVAYEMACQLHREGEEVHLLALINSTAPNSSYGQFHWTPVSAFKFARNLCLRAAYSVAFHPEKLLRFVQWKAQSLAKRLRPQPENLRPALTLETFDPENLIDLSEFPEEQRRIWQTHLRALIRYRPQTYPGRLTLFRNPVHLLYSSFDSTFGWNECASGGVNVKIIPGAHETIMEEPGVQTLAAALRNCLTAY